MSARTGAAVCLSRFGAAKKHGASSHRAFVFGFRSSEQFFQKIYVKADLLQIHSCGFQLTLEDIQHLIASVMTPRFKGVVFIFLTRIASTPRMVEKSFYDVAEVFYAYLDHFISPSLSMTAASLAFIDD